MTQCQQHQQDNKAATIILDENSCDNADRVKTRAMQKNVIAKYTEPLLADSPLLSGTVTDYTKLIRTLQQNCRLSKFDMSMTIAINNFCARNLNVDRSQRPISSLELFQLQAYWNMRPDKQQLQITVDVVSPQ